MATGTLNQTLTDEDRRLVLEDLADLVWADRRHNCRVWTDRAVARAVAAFATVHLPASVLTTIFLSFAAERADAARGDADMWEIELASVNAEHYLSALVPPASTT